MSFRRAMYYVQFVGLLAVPAWVFAGRGLFGVYLGWHFKFQMIFCPLAFLVLLSALLLTLARYEVKAARAVSRRDAVLLTTAYSFGIAYGFFMIDAPIAGDRG
ncbi:MAG: MFS transporter, partial [Lacisediminihabitans sp.]